MAACKECKRKMCAPANPTCGVLTLHLRPRLQHVLLWLTTRCTHTHIDTHTHTHAHIHTYARNYRHTQVHIHTHTQTQTQSGTFMHELSHTRAHTAFCCAQFVGCLTVLNLIVGFSINAVRPRGCCGMAVMGLMCL